MPFSIASSIRRYAALSLALLLCPAARAQPAPLAGAASSGDADPVASKPELATPPAGAVSGLGDVNLYPKRVVIDEHNRVATIGIYNRGAGTADYDLTIDDRIMLPDGSITPVAQVTDASLLAHMHGAAAYIRWSPHRVTLGNGEAQTVRLMAHVPPEVPAGEYHAHFSAVAVPPEAANSAGGVSIEQAAGQAPAKGIAVQIVPRFGISIPVILRIGATTLNVTLSGASLTTMPDGARALAFTINRAGTRSAFGDVLVTAPSFKAPVVDARGIGVYTELDRRTVMLAVNPKADPHALAPGTRLTITYTDDDAAPGTVLARQEFIVP